MAARHLRNQHTSERRPSNARKRLRVADKSASHAGLRRAKSIPVLLVCVALVAVTWMVFGQTLTHDFVNFDDHVYVYDNPLVTRGLSADGLITAFMHTHARNWHPLTTISHMVDCQLYGLNAGGHHFTNVLLHSAAVLLLFLLLKQMTDALWPSAFVAALFAIHPLHVESVAWIAERKDVLSAVFFMLTLAAYTSYARRPSPGRYLLVALSLACGLMCKPMLVTTPFVMLLLDYWPLGRMENPTAKVKRQVQTLIAEKIPLFVLSGLSCVATLLAQKGETNAIDQLPFVWRLNNAFVSYVTYIFQMFWPARLAVFYPHPNNHLPLWEVVLAITFLAAVSVLVTALRRPKPYLLTGWFWYIGMLIPVIGVIQVGEQAHADRYTYLPQVGLYIMIAWAAGDMLQYSAGRASRSVLAVTGTTVIAVLCACSFVQTSYWKNSETLWNRALVTTANNDVAHNNLGFLFLQKGEVDKAISEFQSALEIRAKNTQSHYGLGAALIQNNLGNAFARKNFGDEAIRHFQKAIALRPDYADAHFNLGSVLFQQGRIDDAISEWRTTLSIQPRDVEGHRNVANAFGKQKKWKEAIGEYEQILNMAPSDISALNNLAWILATSSDASIRDGARAVVLAQEAVQLSGAKDSNVLRTLAAARAEAGQFPEAIATAEEALAIASAQNRTELAENLQTEIARYRAHLAYGE